LKQSLLVNCLRERPFLFEKPAVRSWKAHSCRQLGGWYCNGILGEVNSSSQALRLPVGRPVSTEALLLTLLVQAFLCLLIYPMELNQ
jgi:hypothetical protein